MAQQQIPKRFIAPIDDANIAAGANIASSKLADGGNFLKKDGSVTMTGSLNAGNQPILGVPTPTNTTDAANKAYVDTAIAALNSLFDSKGSVRAATTANITLTAAQTIDGVSVVAGDRVLVKDQSAPAANGIYIVATGSWTRATDFDLWGEIPGGLVAVEEGTTNGDSLWLSTANQGGTLGTTAITWFQIPFSSAGLNTSNFIYDEIPAGTVNGVNTTFTLANTPIAGTVELFIGVRLNVGAGNDYTITGSTITMLTAPLTGEVLKVNYRK